MTVSYRTASAADLAAIDRVFRTSFCETFAHLYRPEDLAAFLAKFTAEAWAEELGDSGYAFRLAEDAGEVVGYVKLGPSTLPVDAQGKSLELRQLYVLTSHLGAGVGAELMRWALVEARRRGTDELYLTVYTDNHRARRFYARYGFEELGPYAFMVGEQADEDIIMRLRL
jgi:ribosomal protein S18 acetylase RimI-like enzyme